MLWRFAMIDYENLYHDTQKQVTRTIQILEHELEHLKAFQCLCENRVLAPEFEVTHQNKPREN